MFNWLWSAHIQRLRLLLWLLRKWQSFGWHRSVILDHALLLTSQFECSSNDLSFRCCKMHDYCYHAANCPKFLEYFVPYLWKCYRGRPLCGKLLNLVAGHLWISNLFDSEPNCSVFVSSAIDNGEWGGPGSCSASLCECDRALSNCLRRFYCPRKRAVCSSSPLRLLQNILMDFWIVKRL